VLDLVEELMPSARALHCERELADVVGMVERGPGYVRQRRVVLAGGTHQDVVDLLLAEFESGTPAS
jgi:carboxylate-amine ligase